jgi:hypothetical protein
MIIRPAALSFKKARHQTEQNKGDAEHRTQNKGDGGS